MFASHVADTVNGLGVQYPVPITHCARCRKRHPQARIWGSGVCMVCIPPAPRAFDVEQDRIDEDAEMSALYLVTRSRCGL